MAEKDILGLQGNLPLDEALQLQNLNRQQQMAALLMQQGQQQGPAGQMVSGRYVPNSFFQNLQGPVNSILGASLAKSGDTEMTKLAQKIREGQIAEERAALQKAQQGDIFGALQSPNNYGGVNALKDTLIKRALPEPSTLEKEYNRAINDPINPFRGSFNDFKNQMKPEDIMKGQYEGWYNPNAVPNYGNQPARTGVQVSGYNGPAPAAPVNAPNVQVANMPVNAAQMSYQTGRANPAAPVSPMNRPAMSGSALNQANKDIYVENEKERQKALKQLPNDLQQADYAIQTIQQMIGDARIDDKGNVVYKKYDPVSKKWVEGAEPHEGFGQYVGIGFPYLSNLHGTDTAGFRSLYDSLKGQAFLEAFQRIKGAGAITEIEGAKATQALLKLNNAQSEKEFIKYAREFQENLQKGMALAKQKAGVSQDYTNPVNKPVMRWNPRTNSWEQ